MNGYNSTRGCSDERTRRRPTSYTATKVQVWRGVSGQWHWNTTNFECESIGHGACRRRDEAYQHGVNTATQWRNAVKKTVDG